jgi:hypothetical protein
MWLKLSGILRWRHGWQGGACLKGEQGGRGKTVSDGQHYANTLAMQTWRVVWWSPFGGLWCLVPGGRVARGWQRWYAQGRCSGGFPRSRPQFRGVQRVYSLGSDNITGASLRLAIPEIIFLDRIAPLHREAVTPVSLLLYCNTWTWRPGL